MSPISARCCRCRRRRISSWPGHSPPGHPVVAFPVAVRIDGQKMGMPKGSFKAMKSQNRSGSIFQVLSAFFTKKGRRWSRLRRRRRRRTRWGCSDPYSAARHGLPHQGCSPVRRVFFQTGLDVEHVAETAGEGLHVCVSMERPGRVQPLVHSGARIGQEIRQRMHGLE